MRLRPLGTGKSKIAVRVQRTYATLVPAFRGAGQPRSNLEAGFFQSGQSSSVSVASATTILAAERRRDNRNTRILHARKNVLAIGVGVKRIRDTGLRMGCE